MDGIAELDLHSSRDVDNSRLAQPSISGRSTAEPATIMNKRSRPDESASEVSTVSTKVRRTVLDYEVDLVQGSYADYSLFLLLRRKRGFRFT